MNKRNSACTRLFQQQLRSGIFFVWRGGAYALLSLSLTIILTSWALAGNDSAYTGTLRYGLELFVIEPTGMVKANRVLFLADTTAGGSVILSAGALSNPYYIFGGFDGQSGHNSTVTNNRVIVTGGLVDTDPNTPSSDSYSGSVYGGFAASNLSGNASATTNVVSMSNGSIRGTSVFSGIIYGGLYGAFAEVSDGGGSALAQSNSATLSGGTLDGATLVGGAAIQYYGTGGGTATASANSVIMSGGQISTMGEIYGGWARAHNGPGEALAQNNSAVMSGGTLSGGGGLYGGYVRSSSLYPTAGKGTAVNNTATLSGGTIHGGGLYGGYAYGYDTPDAATASANTAQLIAGSVSGSVYGGWARSDKGLAQATGNIVNLSGGSAGGNIYGGYAVASNAAGHAQATGNTVIISGTPSFAPSSNLYGGYTSVNGVVQTGFAQTIAGNTLLVATSGVRLDSVRNFANYVFQLPTASGQSMLSTNTPVALSGGSGAGAWQSSVSLSGIASGPSLPRGYTATLINAVDAAHKSFTINGKTFGTGNSTLSGVKQGYARVYTLNLSLNGTALNASVADMAPSTEAKAPATGRAAAFSFLNAGADLTAGLGMNNAMVAGLAAGNEPGLRLNPFAAMTGGHMQYTTGGHVSVNGVAYMVGLARTVDVGPGLLLGGIFFENGYSSYKHTSDAADGQGNSAYYGGGIMARYGFTQGPAAGLYGEATFRAGATHTTYDGDATPLGSPHYTASSPYYGAHAGLGYAWDITPALNLDSSLKYFWIHQDANSVRVLGDPFRFKAVDSYRVRPGVRLSYKASEKVKPYVGLAYEYEFGGKIQSTSYGLDIPAPSLKGGSGMGEVGVSLTPAGLGGLRFDLGAQGYTGKRAGVTGFLNLTYDF